MPREKKPDSKKINYWLDNIQSGMDRLYKNTYYSDKKDLDDMNSIVGDIESNIASIIQRNQKTDISGISKLYSKAQLNSASNNKNVVDKVKELFEDNPLTDDILKTYIGNKWIKDIDDEIDTVLKYCTKMGEALDLIRDSVLSSDSFSKDFINAKLPFSTDDINVATFQYKSDTIIRSYTLQKRLKEWYDNASRYGEQFVYIVPYSKAIASLLSNKPDVGMVNSVVKESGEYGVKETSVVESSMLDKMVEKENSELSIKIVFDKSYTLRSSIQEAKTSHHIVKNSNNSLFEQVFEEKADVNKDAKYKDKLDVSLPDDLEIPKDIDKGNFGSEGLVSSDSFKNKVTPKELKIKGAVVKRLKRENVLPLYVEDDICLGYYYFEFDRDLNSDFYTASDRYADGRIATSMSMSSASKRVSDNLYQDTNIENIVMNVASNISAGINKNFVNANQDLTKEIYAILKSNELFSQKYRTNELKVSFLPEEDVHVLAFNVDPDTHRGVSDCAKGLIPAKLFSCLYISDVIGTLTRGQDKRVYYVKQTVDTNISQTLMNVINQIKKSNFNIRQIENINSILNITGRFNDYVIPVGAGGDSPIQFEVMPGQQFEPKTDLMNALEEMAVNSTNCPIELVQSRMSPDFATQFTSSSLKILRFVYSRQEIVQEFISGVLTKIYNCEYGEDNYVEIDCELPPPMFLNLTNTSQLMQNAQEQANLIAEYEYNGDTSDNVDQKKGLFIRKYIRWSLSSYIKSSVVDRLKNSVDMELKVETESQDNNDEGM